MLLGVSYSRARQMNPERSQIWVSCWSALFRNQISCNVSWKLSVAFEDFLVEWGQMHNWERRDWNNRYGRKERETENDLILSVPSHSSRCFPYFLSLNSHSNHPMLLFKIFQGTSLILQIRVLRLRNVGAHPSAGVGIPSQAVSGF